MTGLACVTGRFQPVHRQHIELFTLAVRAAGHLVIAVTNPDPSARHEEAAARHRHTDAANPFTYFERARLLSAAVGDAGFLERTTIVPLDLTRPAHWRHYVPRHAVHYVRASGGWERQKAALLREAGYDVRLLPAPSPRLSSSDIRARLRTDEWEADVPPATVPLLRELTVSDAPAGRDRP